MLDNTSSSADRTAQIICCDAEPDSRQKLTEKLTAFGYSVLATGNPQIASGLLHEKPVGALVVSMDRVKLSLVSVVVDARRTRPRLPIVVILAAGTRDQIPPGLADIVLVNPTDSKLRSSLNAFVENNKRTLAAAC